MRKNSLVKWTLATPIKGLEIPLSITVGQTWKNSAINNNEYMWIIALYLPRNLENRVVYQILNSAD